MTIKRGKGIARTEAVSYIRSFLRSFLRSFVDVL